TAVHPDRPLGLHPGAALLERDSVLRHWIYHLPPAKHRIRGITGCLFRVGNWMRPALQLRQRQHGRVPGVGHRTPISADRETEIVTDHRVAAGFVRNRTPLT